MSEREFITQVSQVGKETTEGTAVAALTRFLNMSHSLDIDLVLNKYKPTNYRRATRFDPGKHSAKISVEGKPSYTAFPYIFNYLYKRVLASTPGGATNARDWTWEPSSTATEVIDTFTLQKGSAQGAEQSAGCFYTAWGMSGNPDEVNFTAEGLGRGVLDSVADGIKMSTGEVQTVDLSGDDDPTGGTWTLTIFGTTLSAIAYDVSASALQALINAISAPGAADVTVSKTLFVYTINFPFYLGNVTTVTTNNGAGLTGGGGDTFAITVTTATPGVAATEVTDRPMIPEHVSWFADSTSGGLGGTLLTKVLAWSIGEAGMWELFWTVNAANAGAAAGKVSGDEPVLEIMLTVEADAAGLAFYHQAKEGQTKFLRFQAQDDANSIESTMRYQTLFDFAAKVKSISPFGSDQKLYKYDITFEVVHDSGWGKSMSLVNRNAVTTA
jgi:hypothetical protein